MEPTIKITKINNRYHARLFVGDVIRDEMACESRLDVGFISREMLRWLDKGGEGGLFAKAARYRQHKQAKGNTGPKGQIWYQHELDKQKAKVRAKQELE